MLQIMFTFYIDLMEHAAYICSMRRPESVCVKLLGVYIVDFFSCITFKHVHSVSHSAGTIDVTAFRTVMATR